jgi:hypothetical protein
MLRVKRNPEGVKVSSERCYKVRGITGGTNAPEADLVVYVTSENANACWTAWATSCSKDPGSFRANIGQININEKYLKTSEAQMDSGRSWMIHLENNIAT